MVNVGIIGESSIEKILCGLFEGICEKANVTTINNCNVNYHFEVLAINDFIGKIDKYVSALTNNDVLIINADNKEINGILHLNRAIVITYGYNNKACITCSSITESDVTICVQRSFPALNGDVVEPREFVIKIQSQNISIHNILSAAAIALVSGVGI